MCVHLQKSQCMHPWLWDFVPLQSQWSKLFSSERSKRQRTGSSLASCCTALLESLKGREFVWNKMLKMLVLKLQSVFYCENLEHLFCNKRVRGQHPRVKSLATGLLELNRRNTNGLMAELDTCDTSKIAYKKEFEQGVKELSYLSNLAITSST